MAEPLLRELNRLRGLILDPEVLVKAVASGRQKGEQPTVNDTTSYNNEVKVVPADLLKPLIVTKDNAADVYKNDETLFPLTQGK